MKTWRVERGSGGVGDRWEYQRWECGVYGDEGIFGEEVERDLRERGEMCSDNQRGTSKVRGEEEGSEGSERESCFSGPRLALRDTHTHTHTQTQTHTHTHTNTGTKTNFKKSEN